MMTKQLSLAYRAPGPDIPPCHFFSNIFAGSESFPPPAFFTGVTPFFLSPMALASSFSQFFSIFFKANAYTILPYPVLKTVK